MIFSVFKKEPGDLEFEKNHIGQMGIERVLLQIDKQYSELNLSF